MQKYLRTFTTFFTILYLFSSSLAPTLAAVSYLYDANGNMTSNGTDCFEYNEANQLKKVKKCATNEVVAEYVYDYKGNRIVKKVYTNGTLQKTAYSPTDDYETVKIASNSAVQNTSYYFANNQVIAKKDHTGKLTYFHNDHLGSTQVITDTSGNLVENTSYDPWGEIAQGGTQSKFLYTGQENDPETNLHYYNARYYDPHIRRFTQPDDIIQNIYDPQSLNRYSYVRNNPIINTDPTGHFVDTVLDIGFLAYDVYELAKNPHDAMGWSALGADALCLVLPAATGGGLAIRAASHIDDVDKVADVTKLSMKNIEKAKLSGDAGQMMLEKIYPRPIGYPQFTFPNVPNFNTPRTVDIFVEDARKGLEAKAGYQSLTKHNKSQVLKDVELIRSNKMEKAEYYFFESIITGKKGPSKPYANFLKQNGIWYTIK